MRPIPAEALVGVREALWLIGLALAGYAAWQFLRALRMPRAGRGEAVGAGEPGDARGGKIGAALGPAMRPAASAAAAGATAQADEDDAFLDYAPLPGPQADLPLAAETVPPAQPDAFQLELENSRLRQALQAQRGLVELQQHEIDRLVADITTLQDELDRLREQPASSPEYAEALVLAAQGLNAEMIASRCGITLAEAELVLSLARQREGAP